MHFKKVADKTFCSMIQAVINVDGYYYSNTYDITHTLQRLQNTSPDFRNLPMLERADTRFVWNHFVMKDIAMHREVLMKKIAACFFNGLI